MRKRRSRAGKGRTREEYERGQIEAMRALIGGIGPGTPLGQLTMDLLSPTVSRDGKMLFSKGLVSDTLMEVLQRGHVATPKTEKEGAEDFANMTLRATDISSVERDAGYIIEVAQSLAEKTLVPATETFGQCLWRYRELPVLQQEPHFEVVEDLRWVNEPGASTAVMEMCVTVFNELCREKGYRMANRAWSKVVEFIRGNPVLRARLGRSDADRVFHAEVMREVRERGSNRDVADVGFSVTLRGFLGLLVDIAEVIKVHPFMVMLAVGAHADHMVEDRRQREEAAAAEGVPWARAVTPEYRAMTPERSMSKERVSKERVASKERRTSKERPLSRGRSSGAA